MSPRPGKLLIRQDALEGRYPEDATNAIVSFVNALRDQLWRDDELPEVFWEVYFADFYNCQVRNGGHSQFFHNIERVDRARELALVRAGLLRVGATRTLAIFDRAIALVTANPSLIKRLDDGEYWEEASDAASAYKLVDRDHRELSKEFAWPERCKQWLMTSDGVEHMTHEAFVAALKTLADAVPDRAAREAEAARAEEAAMPAWERALRDACAERGLVYEGLTAGQPGKELIRWAFFASGMGGVAEERTDGTLGAVEWGDDVE